MRSGGRKRNYDDRYEARLRRGDRKRNYDRYEAPLRSGGRKRNYKDRYEAPRGAAAGRGITTTGMKRH
jgi:hypothetical protein